MEPENSQNQAAQSSDKPARKVAHRLNNVLGIIRGNIEMIEVSESGLSKKSQLRLEKLNIAIDEASDLVSELYAFEALMEEKLHKTLNASTEKPSSENRCTRESK